MRPCLLGSRRLKLYECIGLWSGRKGAQGTDGRFTQETHGTGNGKGYDLSVPWFSRQAAPTRIAFHSNPAAPCKGEVLGTGKPPTGLQEVLRGERKGCGGVGTGTGKAVPGVRGGVLGFAIQMRDYFMGEKSAGRM